MKIRNIFFKTSMLFLITCSSAVLTQAQRVTLAISNIKSTEGQILVAVFKDQQGFKEEKPTVRHRFPKNAVNNGTMQVSFDLPAGTYGIALVDDQNKNGKLDKNVVGIPKEGVGFSNFYLSGMSKPSFSDFKFDLKGASLTVECKFRHF